MKNHIKYGLTEAVHGVINYFSEGDEVKEVDIYEMIHPQKHASRAHFIKPKAPSRGGRRLIR